jgi:peptide/nickel transport system ATP-binding protein
MMSELVYSDLCVSYGTTPVLSNIGFSINSGEIVGLVGESGCGKSTILRAAINLLDDNAAITSGTVFLNEQELQSLSRSELNTMRGKRIAMIFQNYEMSFCPTRTIGKHFTDLLQSHRDLDRVQTTERLFSLFERLGLSDKQQLLKTYTFELSGGMNQRVALAFAMVTNPEFLLADEPTSSLDVSTQVQVIKELQKLKNDFGTGIVLATHNIGLLADTADKVGVVYAGQLIEFGTSEAILDNPQHPYTHALFAAVPTIGGGIPKSIPGMPPDYASLGAGCRFAARCPFATKLCHTDTPQMRGNDIHKIRCHEVG